MDSLSVTPATPTDPGVRDLLQAHFDMMRGASPEESCHVLPPEALLEGGIFLLAARDGDVVLGLGALKPLTSDHGELKSMHTAAAARGRGVARQVLEGLMTQARAMGLTRLSLETGSDEMFAPARALYAAHGFTDCPPFGDYVEDPLSVFMTRTL